MLKYYKKGFTLIELLLVIAIIGLLASIVLVSLQGAAASARDTKRDSESDTLRKTLEVYHGNHGKYPSSLDSESEEGCCIENNPIIKNEILPYLSSIPRDPSYDPGEEDNLDKYCYRYKTTGNGEEYKIRVNYEKTEPKEIASWGGGGITFGPTGIEISGCSTLDQAGETYLLTADILDHGTDSCMNITADNVTLNCQGHTIDGNDSARYGIDIYRGSAVTTSISIENCVVSDWYMANVRIQNAKGNTLTNIDSSSSNQGFGYEIVRSDSTTINNSTANSNAVRGFSIVQSHYNTITDCAASLNGDSPAEAGFYFQESDYLIVNNIISNNNYDGIYAYFITYGTFNNITTNSNTEHGFDTSGPWRNTVTGLTSNLNGGHGLFMYNADENNFNNIAVNSNTQHGIRFNSADDNIFTDVTSTLNDYGIRVDVSDNNTFTNINADSNNSGIYIYNDSVNNVIIESDIDSNVQYGVVLDRYANDGEISNSIIANNGDAGLYIMNDGVLDPRRNYIYNNLFNNSGVSGNIKIDVDMTETNYFNIAKQAGTRIYSAGNQIGGNYYTNNTASGHSDNCPDSDNDGFCDDPYEHATNNVDAFPLSDKFE